MKIKICVLLFIFLYFNLIVGVEASTVSAPCAGCIHVVDVNTDALGGWPFDRTVFGVVETNEKAYCIQPGLEYSTGDYYPVEEYAIENCSSSNESFHCGLASIMQAASANPLSDYRVDYRALVTALRLWTFYKSNLGGDGHVQQYYNTTKTIFKDTAHDIIDNNYAGTSKPPGTIPSRIYATAEPGNTIVKTAFDLFKKCANGSLPAVRKNKVTLNKTSINLSKGSDTIVFTTNYTNQTIVNVEASYGINAYIIEKKVSGNKYLITVKVEGGCSQTSEGSFSLKLTASGPGASLANIKMYRPGDTSHQIMMVYSGTDTVSNFNFGIAKCSTVNPNCCSNLNVSNNAPTNCENSSSGTISDPQMDCIMNACAANQSKQKDYENASYISSGNSSKYCTLYCREDISLEFMKKVDATPQKFFQYPYQGKVDFSLLNTVSATSTKQCTSVINYDKWSADYFTANDEILKYGYQRNTDQYNAWVAKRTQLLTDIENCNLYTTQPAYKKIVEDYPKNFQDQVTFTYEDPEYGTSAVIGKKAQTANNVLKFCAGCLSTNSLTSNTTKNIEYWTCTNGSCSNSGTTVPANTLADLRTTINVDYYQSKEFYTQAYTGEVKAIEEASSNPENYQQLPLYIYPIGLRTLEGKYWVEFDYKNIGDKNRPSGIQIKPNPYKCYYEVKKDQNQETCVTCDKDGRTYFYRNIDLNTIFPGDRDRGSNWVGAVSTVKEIQNVGNDIWLETPSYNFTLTPTNIQKIKEYNKVKELTRGYLDMSLKCNGFSKCKSDFLTSIVTDGYASKADLTGRDD